MLQTMEQEKSIFKQSFKSSLISKNIIINKRRTSVRLEPEMWKALYEIAQIEQCTIHDLCSLVDHCKTKNESQSLTSAIRVFIMLYFRGASTKQGHTRAGHGSFSLMKQRIGLTTTAH